MGRWWVIMSLLLGIALWKGLQCEWYGWLLLSHLLQRSLDRTFPRTRATVALIVLPVRVAKGM